MFLFIYTWSIFVLKFDTQFVLNVCDSNERQNDPSKGILICCTYLAKSEIGLNYTLNLFNLEIANNF